MAEESAPPDTRAALIEAALHLLLTEGMGGLTLRRAAARAGVSHAAPAHHFDGLPGLLTATAARAFRLFTKAMTDARDAAPPDPRAQLLAVGQGYLAFARDHAGLFHLMFNSPALSRNDHDLMQASAESYAVLRAACAPLAAADPHALETAVWALVHGFAALSPAPTEIACSEGRAAPTFEALLWPLVDGFANSSR